MKLRGEKPKYSEQTLFHFHIAHHKSHTDWLSIELGYPQRERGRRFT